MYPDGQWDSPHAPDARVDIVQATRNVRLVRVAPAGGNPYGEFYVLEEHIRGMTPKQIQEYLCLPYTPTQFQFVTIPKGRELFVSKIGPQMHFENGLRFPDGGGLQFEIRLRPEEEVESLAPWFTDLEKF